ncbi:hypothetical protein BDM02DRAFT_1676093 [Thelephora ganbajun]|uniref:Uncharacterized protein n=1 Tax=Thelephora ganbajun TaxID=370292 RepID=A0ACB6ZW48_THEGA|nr:hypothetical protein BDM02DRAFT_1676093 [Thelephora ganbajun]
MSSARKLTDIPSCMRMSFNYPWESSPEKEIDDPLSYNLPDITSDFEVIYGEGAAKNFFLSTPFPSTPTKDSIFLPAPQGDLPYTDILLELFGPELTPGLLSKTESSPASLSGYASDLSSLSCLSPSPSPEHGVPGGKKEQQTTISNARTRSVPYRRRPLDSPHSPASPFGWSDCSRLPPSPASSLRSSTSSSVSSSHDDVLTAGFMRSLQFSTPRTPTAGPSSLPESHGSALCPQRLSTSPAKLRLPQNITANFSQQPDAFARRYCRYPGCNKRFSDKRTTERHRLTHLKFGTYVCPNPTCDSRTKARPHFASDFSLGRHLRLAAADSPCAVGKGQKLSLFKLNAAQVEALVQQALIPFDPAIHTPF